MHSNYCVSQKEDPWMENTGHEICAQNEEKRLLSELCQDGRCCLGSESSSLTLDEQGLDDPWEEMGESRKEFGDQKT